jgi:hypothetical protein
MKELFRYVMLLHYYIQNNRELFSFGGKPKCDNRINEIVLFLIAVL